VTVHHGAFSIDVLTLQSFSFLVARQPGDDCTRFSPVSRRVRGRDVRRSTLRGHFTEMMAITFPVESTSCAVRFM